MIRLILKCYLWNDKGKYALSCSLTCHLTRTCLIKYLFGTKEYMFSEMENLNNMGMWITRCNDNNIRHILFSIIYKFWSISLSYHSFSIDIITTVAQIRETKNKITSRISKLEDLWKIDLLQRYLYPLADVIHIGILVYFCTQAIDA